MGEETCYSLLVTPTIEAAISIVFFFFSIVECCLKLTLKFLESRIRPAKKEKIQDKSTKSPNL